MQDVPTYKTLLHSVNSLISPRVVDIPTNSGPNIPLRNSKDIISSDRGEKLVNLCMMSDLHIVNGRKNGDLFGEKTCFRWNGSSLIDLVICSSSLFSSITFLQVGELLPWMTDHCPVTISINLSYISKIESYIKLVDMPEKFIWKSGSKIRYENVLQSKWFCEKIHSLSDNLDKYSTDQAVEQIAFNLKLACEKSGIRKRKLKMRDHAQKTNKPWFDDKCNIMKQGLNVLDEKLTENPKDINIREQLNTEKKIFKKLNKMRRNMYRTRIVNK